MPLDYRQPAHCLYDVISAALWDLEVPVTIRFRGANAVVIRFEDMVKAEAWASEWREQNVRSEEPGAPGAG